MGPFVPLFNLILVVALALELWFTENCNVVLSSVNLEHLVLCHGEILGNPVIFHVYFTVIDL